MPRHPSAAHVSRIATVLVCAFFGACERAPSVPVKTRTLPVQTRAILDQGTRFELLSLHPMPLMLTGEKDADVDTFHGYEVLGRTDITDAVTRNTLVTALAAGIAEKEFDDAVAACFNPRHGISATLEEETADLVICFECGPIRVYAPGGGSTVTTSSPRTVFNTVLRDAGLPLAGE